MWKQVAIWTEDKVEVGEEITWAQLDGLVAFSYLTVILCTKVSDINFFSERP